MTRRERRAIARSARAITRRVSRAVASAAIAHAPTEPFPVLDAASGLTFAVDPARTDDPGVLVGLLVTADPRDALAVLLGPAEGTRYLATRPTPVDALTFAIAVLDAGAREA